MLKRLILSVLIGVATFIVVLIIGAVIGLFPVIGGVGALIQSLAFLFGLVAGVWFFLTQERFWQ